MRLSRSSTLAETRAEASARMGVRVSATRTYTNPRAYKASATRNQIIDMWRSKAKQFRAFYAIIAGRQRVGLSGWPTQGRNWRSRASARSSWLLALVSALHREGSAALSPGLVSEG